MKIIIYRSDNVFTASDSGCRFTASGETQADAVFALLYKIFLSNSENSINWISAQPCPDCVTMGCNKCNNDGFIYL